MNDTTRSTGADVEAAPTSWALAVFGRDEGGKPHASKFAAIDAALAEKAAGLMGMRVLRLASGEHQELGAQLPSGRVFSSGKAFVPFVKGAIFDKLAAAPGAFTPIRPPEADMVATPPRKAQGGPSIKNAVDASATSEKAPSGPATLPTDRANIKVGHHVLAAESDAPEVWYLALVTALKGPELLQLKWAGEWSEEPPFVRHREHLALLPPAVAATFK